MSEENSFNIYQEFTKTTVIPLGEMQLIYYGLKLTGESGEFSEKLGKLIRSGKWRPEMGPIKDVVSDQDRIMMMQELGDVLWYVSRIADELGYKMSSVVAVNVDKLVDRQQRGVLDGKGDSR